jgi:type III restriction enzyme
VNIVLKDFQDIASENVLTNVRGAVTLNAANGGNAAVILSAPTGSGKTMIVTDVIEKIIEGYDSYAPNPQATFLWLTDQPQLNEQTRRKMLATSSVLGPSQLVTIETSFDQHTFTPGIVYFLNIQKMRKDVNLVTGGDGRTYTIWQTITNTIRGPGTLHLILDEAHRGLGSAAPELAHAETIVQKFIKGSPGEIPAVPLIIGVSATPGRFQKIIAGASRASLPTDVDPADVRASGLIKDMVRFKTPKEETPSDLTLLRVAVTRWREYEAAWKGYCERECIPDVRPLLIVQVQDGDATHASRTNLEDVLTTIKDAAGGLPDAAFGHSFQDGNVLKVNNHTVRYIQPSDITDDPDVQVVLFKMNLSTGWDCPRAEVMMSFRSASDATLIAQLVGRMVRTPLARRVDTNDMLNTVTLVLPHYDAEELKTVVAKLKSVDPDDVPPTDFVDDDDVVDLTKNAGLEACFMAAASIPSYVIPTKSRLSQVRRLMRLARLLTDNEIELTAVDEARSSITTVLENEYNAVKDTEEFLQSLRNLAGVVVEERTFDFNGDLGDVPEEDWASADASDVEKRFGEVGRQIGEGLHKIYWRLRIEDVKDERIAKTQAMAILLRDGMLARVTETASAKTTAWLRAHHHRVAAMADEDRQVWNEIAGATKEPEPATLTLINSIESKLGKEPKEWIKHIYVDARSRFNATLNTWETASMTAEVGSLDVIGWFRNPPRKQYSLCVPYKNGDNVWAGLYPDFIVFRQVGDNVVVDIVDPHLVDLDDAWHKAKGLAEYVARHPNAFGRVLLERMHQGALQRLDLALPAVRDQVLRVTTNQHLMSLYDTLGY